MSFFNRDKRLQILLYTSGGRESNWNENDGRAADILAHDLDVRFEPERFYIRGEDTLTLNLLQSSASLRLRLDDALRVLSITSPEGGNHIFFRVRGQNSLVVSLGPYSGRLGEVMERTRSPFHSSRSLRLAELWSRLRVSSPRSVETLSGSKRTSRS